MDKPATISNPQLTDAMYAVVARDDAETRQALYRTMLESTFILPVADDMGHSGPPQRLTLAQDASFRLVAGENDAGEMILVAFTDEDAVRAWIPEGTSYIALRAPELFGIAVYNDAAEVLINPSGPVSGRVWRQEFEALAQGRLPFDDVPPAQTLPAGTRVLISSPAEPPSEDWRDEVASAMGLHPQIVAAYFFQLHVGTEAPRWVVGVHFAPGTDEPVCKTIMQSIISTVGQPMDSEEMLHFIILEDDNFLGTVEDTVPKLYPH